MRRRNPSSNSPSKSHAFHAKEIPSTQTQRSAVTLHQRWPNRPLVHTSSSVQRVFWNGHPLSGYNTLMIKKCTPFPCIVSEYEPYDFSNQNCILPICINEIFYNILNNGISLKFHQIYIYIYFALLYVISCMARVVLIKAIFKDIKLKVEFGASQSFLIGSISLIATLVI